jgi:heme-degrading monooxygenase HmoA
MIQIIWEFVARRERAAEFERCYSSKGTWAELFRRAPGYRGTSLLRDAEQPRRFVTIDRWESAEAQREMREKFAREYEALDESCEGLTESERRIGVFEGE